MRRVVHEAVVASLLILLVGGCADDASDTTSASTTSTTVAPSSETEATTTSTPEETTTSRATRTFGECGGTSPSPTRFDPEAGTYYVLLMGIDVAARTMEFDVLQLLTGDEAADAYHEEHPDDPDGPPNGYWTRNENPAVYQAEVTQGVDVRLVRLQEDADADLDPGTFDELPTYLAAYRPEGAPELSWNPFWLTITDRRVTAICEQFIP